MGYEYKQGRIDLKFAKRILKTYCKFLGIEYVDNFLTLKYYSRKYSDTFPGLRKFLFLRNKVKYKESKEDLEEFESAVRTIAKNVCYTQLKYLTDRYTGIVDISNYRTLYIPVYLRNFDIIDDRTLYMVLAVFRLEYVSKVKSLFNNSNLRMDTVSNRLLDKRDEDKLFGGYSINYVLKNIDDVLQQNYKENCKSYDFDSEFLMNTFKDNLIKIIELFYVNKSVYISKKKDWYAVASCVLEDIIESKCSMRAKVNSLIKVGLIPKPD